MKHKSIKKGVVFFLALFLFVLTPLTAFGYGVVDGQGTLYVVASSGTGPIYENTSAYGEGATVRYNNSNREQTDLQFIEIVADFNASFEKGDILSMDFVIPLGRYLGFDFDVSCYTYTEKGAKAKRIFQNSGSVNKDTEVNDGDLSYYYAYSANASSNNTFHFENSAGFSYNGAVKYTIVLKNFKYSTTNLNLTVYLNDFTVSIESPESGQSKKLLSGLSSIIEFVRNIFTKITELPQAIGDFINSLGDKISGLFTNLTNNIKGWFADVGKWFTDLGNNIKQWFTNLTNNLKTWFSNIGQWFTELGNDISSWFNKLFNKLWWGNENGEAAYQPPVFSSGLTDVIKKLDEYCDSLDDTLGQIDNSADVASDYIKQGTGVINDVLGVLPSAVIVLITFGIVFIFSRKVVGR